MVRNLLQLPAEIIVTILKNLSVSDLHNVILTCKTLRSIVLEYNTIWRSVYCANRLILNIKTNRSRKEVPLYDQCRIASNWCRGVFKKEVLAIFSLKYMPWMEVHDSELIVSTGSELHCWTIRKGGLPIKPKYLWHLDTPIVKRVGIRTNDISRFVLKDNWLVCGNRDGSSSIFEVNNIRETPKLIKFSENCHKRGAVEVSAVEIMPHSNGYYAVTASSYNPCVKLWDCAAATDKVRSSFPIPVLDCDGVRCMALAKDKNRLAMGLEGNSRPILLDGNVGQFMIYAKETRHPQEALKDIVWHDENTLAAVSHSGILQITDVRMPDTVRELMDPFQSSLYSLKSDGKNVVVTGSCHHSRCVLYDVRQTLNSVQIYFTNPRWSPVYCLDFDFERLITAVDRAITTLNFNVFPGNAEKRDHSKILR